MRRHLRLVLTVLMGVFVCLAVLVWGKMPPDVPPGTGGEAVAVVEAVANLKSSDYSVVRDAIQTLSALVDAPNIKIAVDPLIKVLSCRDGFYDSYTRCMAASALLEIGMTLGEHQGAKALDAVMDELETGNVDVVRAACAKALGGSGWGPAYDPLVEANASDPSPLVRSVACEALIIYTNGQYSSANCFFEEEETALAPVPMFSMPGGISTGGTRDEEEAMLRWMKNHILLPPEALLQMGVLPQEGDTP